MKASSESGECASLISVVLPVAGFVGIAFCDLSLLAFSPRPVEHPQSHSDLLTSQAHWSHRKNVTTPASQRGTSGADSTSAEAALLSAEE
jgi:hypothetical protein